MSCRALLLLVMNAMFGIAKRSSATLEEGLKLALRGAEVCMRSCCDLLAHWHAKREKHSEFSE